jgi:hypothetical protein
VGLASHWLARSRSMIGDKRVAAYMAHPLLPPERMSNMAELARAMARCCARGFETGVASGLTNRLGDPPLGMRLRRQLGSANRQSAWEALRAAPRGPHNVHSAR